MISKISNQGKETKNILQYVKHRRKTHKDKGEGVQTETF